MTPRGEFAGTNLARSRERFRAARLGLLVACACFLAAVLVVLATLAAAWASPECGDCAGPLTAWDFAVSVLAIVGASSLIDWSLRTWLERK